MFQNMAYIHIFVNDIWEGKKFVQVYTNIICSAILNKVTSVTLFKTALLFNLHTLTSKNSVALEGILGTLPADPYAYSGLHNKWQISPFFMVAIPISHALITWPNKKE